MKKLLFMAAVGLVLAGCGNSKEKERQDSVRVADSLAQVAAEKQALAVEQDSIMRQQIDEEYALGLTVKAGKENVKNLPESTNVIMRLPATVTNHTSIVWEGKDYKVTYSYLTEYWDENGEQDRWYPKSFTVHAVEPMSETAIIDKNEGWEYKELKITPLLTKEEFAERFREQTVFDAATKKFVPKNRTGQQ